MNKIIILTSLLLISFIGSLAAQNVGFSYQAVALDRSKAEGFGRDTEGEVLSSRNISVRFSISEGSIEGTNVYQETHETTTDVFGMFRLIVGRGQQMGNKPIDELNWGNTAYFLHVEIDLNGQFEYLGAEELLGSPYALNVKNQSLELTGNQLSISEGNSVNLADNDATNELQTLSKEGNELILSNGGGRVTMETGGAGNQTLTRAGNEISLSNNGGTVSIDDEDSDITNEIQDLQLIANELRITNNSTATSIDLLKYLDDTQLSEGDLLSMLVENGYVTEGDLTNYLTANGYLTAEVDGDITNEIQDLQLSGDDLVITNNGSATTLDLSKYLDDTQISEADLLNLLVSNGYITQTELNTYLTSNGYLTAEVDGSVTNEIQDLQLSGNNLTITNNGTATTIDLSTYLDNTDTQLTEAEVDAFANNNGYLTSANIVFATTSNVTSNSPGTIATDDFVFGSTSLNDIAGTDDDNRMFFDKSKGAFRAGIMTAIQTLNIGIGSFGSGASSAWGDYSFAAGASGADGDYSFASGRGWAVGNYSFASGRSRAIGVNAFSSGQSEAEGNNSFATSGGYAIGEYSFAAGYKTIALSYAEVALGANNTGYNPLSRLTFNSADRLFVLGNGAGANSQSDALIILKSGATTLNGALTIDADNVGGSDGYTLPGQDGANGQVMTTDGSGVVSWSYAPSSGAFATASNITSNSPGTIATDDFVFGSTSLNDIAGTDDDNRMFFDKSKGAFRAGGSVGMGWDDALVGDYSFASGSAVAIGAYSFAAGRGARADGDNSFASGSTAEALGDNSFASGQSRSFSENSFSSGQSWATNAFAFASGKSFSQGLASFASGEATAVGDYSFAAGIKNSAPSFAEVALGAYTTAYTPADAVNFNSGDRLFVLGNGTADASRSDALIMLKSGATTLNGALTIDADNVGGSDGYTLPGQDGSNGQVMTTDGSGVVSWSSAASSGAFASASNITSNSPGTMATDDFVFGSTSLDDIAGTDDDNRMFFDKSKGAFRAGTATGTDWDEASIGDYSFASGRGRATGAYSFAAGTGEATGDYSAGWGNGTNASGEQATVWGMSTNASGDRSTAWGIFTTASGRRSTAWGFSTVAMGIVSTAWGSQTEARASNSTAWGENTLANGGNSTAWGENTRANGSNSTAWGQETSAPSISETALGQYSTSYVPIGVSNTWNVADRLLTIGNGVDDISRSDAFIILKNGNAKLAGTLTQNSDSRLKKDIAPLNNSLSSITQLQGVHYKWNDVKPHDMESLQTGLIAQEVEKILPDLVTEGSDGYKSVNYIGLVPHLIEAIKALQQENETLKAESQLKDELMDARMAALEAMMAELKAAKTE